MLQCRFLSGCGLRPVRPVLGTPYITRMSTGNAFAALASLTLQDEQRLQGTTARSSSDSTASPTTSPKAIAAEVGSTNGSSAAEAKDNAADSKATAGSSSKNGQHRLKDPLVWIDLEMTGLDIEKDTILELACIITDGDLKLLIEGPDIVIHHPDDVLENMNAWCIDQHGKSGLTQRSRESTVSLAEAERTLLEFIQKHVPYQSAQLAGNSVHVDRLFLLKHMPSVVEHLHYRIVDVSTVGELCRRWSPKVARHTPRKVKAHTAMSDIRESLKELAYYKQKLFSNKS